MRTWKRVLMAVAFLAGVTGCNGRDQPLGADTGPKSKTGLDAAVDAGNSLCPVTTVANAYAELSVLNDGCIEIDNAVVVATSAPYLGTASKCGTASLDQYVLHPRRGRRARLGRLQGLQRFHRHSSRRQLRPLPSQRRRRRDRHRRLEHIRREPPGFLLPPQTGTPILWRSRSPHQGPGISRPRAAPILLPERPCKSTPPGNGSSPTIPMVASTPS